MAVWRIDRDDERCTNDRSAAAQRRTVTMVRSQGSLTRSARSPAVHPVDERRGALCAETVVVAIPPRRIRGKREGGLAIGDDIATAVAISLLDDVRCFELHVRRDHHRAGTDGTDLLARQHLLQATAEAAGLVQGEPDDLACPASNTSAVP